MTSSKFSLKASKRDVFGRKVKRLRKEGLIPANVFGKKIKSEALSVNSKEFSEVFEKAGETQIIHLNDKPVLVSGLQVDPVSFFFSSRRRHTRLVSDWSSDVCSSDLALFFQAEDGIRDWSVTGVQTCALPI